MSSDSDTPEGNADAGADLSAVQERDGIRDAFKVTLPVLLTGLFGLAGLVVVAWLGAPWTALKYVFVVLCLAGPFVVAYSAFFVWVLYRRRGHYHLVLDRDHEQIGLKRLSPKSHQRAEIVGRPETRQSRAGAGEVTISAEATAEQRERVNDDGDRETYRQLVFTSPWSGFVHPLKVHERWRRYEQAREKLVPIAKDALRVRASVDTKSLEATDRAAHAVIRGAEEDAFISGEDPFGWDILDTGDLDDVYRMEESTDELGKEVEEVDDAQ